MLISRPPRDLIRQNRDQPTQADVAEDHLERRPELPPTRLLDWTHSPLVAAHLATKDAYENNTSGQESKELTDGAIWRVNYVGCRELLPDKLKEEIGKHDAFRLTIGMLESAARTLKEFDAVGKKLVAFYEPPSLDERIVNQFALFSVMDASIDLEEWLFRHNNLYERIIAPAELKREFRDKLDQSNVTERILFPGLDGLCNWLKRHYSANP